MRSTRLTVAISVALTLGLAACAPKSSTSPDRAVRQAETEQAPQRIAEAAPADKDKKAETRAEAPAVRADAATPSLPAAPKPVAMPAQAQVAGAPPPGVLSNYSGLVRHRASQPIAGASAPAFNQPANTERYQDHADNPLQLAAQNPVSTFSIDVDTGSYTNVRRMLVANQLPPADAVRAEEFLNYFDYGYTPPATRDVPFSVTTELAAAPWNAQRKLLLVGIKGYELPTSDLPPSNLVFLIDTSGSMYSADKLPLLVDAFKQMVPNLRAQDRVSIVAYAGSAGLVLPPTPGDLHQKIIDALDGLSAGGSTNGGAGIQLAYSVARQHFVRGGVNRVVLATDGDFNVGTTDDTALKTLVARERENGVALTTLGFGAGNYNEQLAEQLADIGNGNHAYIDTLDEARKVLVAEAGGTLYTIAKDVKIQIEFNPAVVAEYRLIGYENRQLRREDFNNDKVDAGEVGSKASVTALYEITPAGARPSSDPLRYQSARPSAAPRPGRELAYLKIRYKLPGQTESRLMERAIAASDTLVDLKAAPEPVRFAVAVAAFGQKLRGDPWMSADLTWDRIADLAQSARGEDPFGQRAEFVQLVRAARDTAR